MGDIGFADEALLEQAAQPWLAKGGYRFVHRPSGQDLPGFLRSYRPDAVLFGPENILLEVIYKGRPDAAERISAIKALLAGHKDWRLEVIYGGAAPQSLSAVPVATLKRVLSGLARDGKAPAAGDYLLMWGVLEAVARHLVPQETTRPQSPTRVVALLASGGALAPEDEDVLMQAASIRNRLIHGEVGLELSSEHYDRLYAIVDTLVDAIEGSMVD